MPAKPHAYLLAPQGLKAENAKPATAADLHVIVAGAGLGGLTAALALAQKGIKITVLEQAPELLESYGGLGIHLSPNATEACAALSCLWF